MSALVVAVSLYGNQSSKQHMVHTSMLPWLGARPAGESRSQAAKKATQRNTTTNIHTTHITNTNKLTTYYKLHKHITTYN